LRDSSEAVGPGSVAVIGDRMPQKFLSLRNFEKYQSMKYSTAPWFKVQHKIFGDRDFIQLPYNLRYLMFGLIHLAELAVFMSYDQSQPPK
jgi:hypothetical protein